LPSTVEGGHPPLPNWARATAHALPRTTAAMLDLDRLHRTKSPLGPALRGKMRWVAAAANRCDYSQATAEADLRRAGVDDKELADLKFGPERWPESERDALEFARKMSIEASAVTDDEVAAIKGNYGESRLVAMVLLLASANFQDRLLISLGTRLEADGPMPPLDVRFSTPPKELAAPDRAPFGDRPGPPVPERVDDPEWAAIPFEVLKKGLDSQKANEGRIRVPTPEEVVAGLPEGYPKPKNPIRIKWTLVCMGYQPELAIAWSACMKAFEADAKLDEVFGESLFWVVTRSIHCFY
jgi:alkylhydroperoxidase family enzyme